MERATVADVVASVSCRETLMAHVSELMHREDLIGAVLALLSACAEHGAANRDEVQGLLQSHKARVATCGRELGTLLNFMPSLRSELPDQPPHLPLSPEPPKNEQDTLRVLGETSVRTWRERLRCLQNITAMDGEGTEGQALWPQLVLQCEDEHPAVAPAALSAIARMAPRVTDPGDVLRVRLAAAVRAQLREGRARGVEAAKACVTAFARHAVLSQAAFLSFLVQVCGCSRDDARVALQAFHDWSDSMNGVSIEGLLNNATRTRSRSLGHNRPQVLQVPQVPHVPQAPKSPTCPVEVHRRSLSVSALQVPLLPSFAPLPRCADPGKPEKEREGDSATHGYDPSLYEERIDVPSTPRPRRSSATCFLWSTTPTSKHDRLAAETRLGRKSPVRMQRSGVTTEVDERTVSCSFLGPRLASDSKLLTTNELLTCSPLRGSQQLGADAEERSWSAESRRVHDLVLDGIEALLSGDTFLWREAIEVLTAWEVSDALLDETEAIAKLLVDAAEKLPAEAVPEMWRALQEMRLAAWLPDTALLDIVVQLPTAASVVAAFLTARIAAGRLSAVGCVDFCLRHVTGGSCHSRTLLHSLLETLQSADTPLLVDLDLQSFAGVVDWVFNQKPHVLESLRPSLELILQHVTPNCVPKRCWWQLRQLLGGPEVPSSLAPSSAKGRASSPVGRRCERLPRQLPAPSSPLPSPPAPLPVLLSLPSVPSQPSPPAPASSLPSSPSPPSSLDLAWTFGRLHRLTTDLSRVDAGDVASKLQQVVSALTRPECMAPLRGFLRRLLARQGKGKEFLDDDYASVRELAADENLPGAFPSTLLPHIRRLLGTSAHRALDCLSVISAVATACGPVLLKVLLQHFSASLLRLSAARGPAQSRARSLLLQLMSLSDEPSEQRLRWFRPVWRALMLAVRKRADAHDPSLLAEAFRLAEDAFTLSGATLGPVDSREVLTVVATSLHDRNLGVRCAAARALGALGRLRRTQIEEDVRAVPHAKEVLACLKRELTPTTTPLRARRASCVDPSPSQAKPRRLQFSPAHRAQSDTSGVLRKSGSVPSLSSTCVGDLRTAGCGADLHAELTAWNAELAHSTDVSVWVERTTDLHQHLEAHFRNVVNVGPVVLSTLSLCEGLVRWVSTTDREHVGEASTMMLGASLSVIRAARSTFASSALRGLCAASAATAFRSIIRTLDELQQLSRASSQETRQAAAPALLELPPLLAHLMDTLEISAQVIAWVRVASELDTLGTLGDSGATTATTRRWALQFCIRCLERLVPLLPLLPSADFPWEVCSEYLRLEGDECHRRTHASEDALKLWLSDRAAWRKVVEKTAEALVRLHPAQAREFMLLASCTGSVPSSLERLFESAP